MDHRADTRDLGLRLREVRRLRQLSLHDVAILSDNEFKASVLGAYERGERGISFPRILHLARLYEIPVNDLLPRRADDLEINGARSRGASGEGVSIDLVRLHEIDGEADAALLAAFVATIQQVRRDFEGDTFTFRNDDIGRLAALMGRSPEDFGSRLDQLGLRAR